MTDQKDPAVSDRALSEDLHDGNDVKHLEREREDAQGLEVFSDPDAVAPASEILEGGAGEETFTSDDFEDEDDQADR